MLGIHRSVALDFYLVLVTPNQIGNLRVPYLILEISLYRVQVQLAQIAEFNYISKLAEKIG